MTCDDTTGTRPADASRGDRLSAPPPWPHTTIRHRDTSAAEPAARRAPCEWPQRTAERRADPRGGLFRPRASPRHAHVPGAGTTRAAALAHRAPVADRPPAESRHCPDPGPVAPAGPSDVERRARRYERRMNHRGSPPGHRHADAEPGRATAESHPLISGPPTRFPGVPPHATPFPGHTPVRSAPDRRARRSPGRNPILRPGPRDRAAPVLPRLRNRNLGPEKRPSARHRPGMLWGIVFTTVFLAIPLGPGTTLTAHAAPAFDGGAGGPVVVGDGGAAGIAGRERSAGEMSGTRSGRPPRTAAGEPTRTVKDNTAAPGPRRAPGPARGGGSMGSAGCGSGSGSGVAHGSGSGVERGSATGTLCGVVPLLVDLVRALIRLAPRETTPCPCPARTR